MTVYPFTLHLGPLAVTGYGLMMMVAFLMGGWAIQLQLRRRALNEEYAADIVIGAVVGGLIGAKLWYVALTGASPFERGGFVWYGGFLGGAAGVILAGVRRRVPLRLTAEVCAPAPAARRSPSAGAAMPSPPAPVPPPRRERSPCPRRSSCSAAPAPASLGSAPR